MGNSRIIRALGLTLALFVAACLPEIDSSGLEPIDDYRDWYQVETSGPIPAHADTIRAIYVNDTALEKSFGTYPAGSVLIKEIYEIENGDRGTLDYFALMRKLNDGEEPDGADLNNGWMFTMIDGSDINGKEVYFDRCWTTCHIGAPFDGTFLSYD